MGPRHRTHAARLRVAVHPLLATLVVATLALPSLADEIEAQGGDRVTGVLAGPDEVAPVLVDLPTGAALRVKLRRSGKGTLVPTIRLFDPTGADLTDLFGVQVKRKGSRVSGAMDAAPRGGMWRLEVGADEGLGTWQLSVTVQQVGRTTADLEIGGGGSASTPFGALAGSRATILAKNTGGGASPTIAGIEGPAGSLDIGAGRLRVKGKKTTLRLSDLPTTGTYDVAVGLNGGGTGSVSTKVSLRAPKPRHARLAHPGAEPISEPDALQIVTTSLARGTLDVAYSPVTIAASGGSPPYTFAITQGSLPDGMALAASGGVSGTPTETGDFDVEVTVTDAVPATSSRSLRLTVGAEAATPSWNLLSPGGTAPAGRSSPGFVHDPVNGRLIVALGSTGSAGFPPVFGDASALTLGGTPAWATLGTGPRARWGPSIVYDSARQRAILYGGNVDGFQTNGEVWALDFSTPSGGWTQLTPTGTAPAARLSHVAVYDSANDRMVVFGGGSGTAPGVASRNDLWELSFASSADGAWTERTPASSPSAREFAGGVYDPTSERLVLFGGMTISGQFGDTWALDLSTPGGEAWTPLSPSGPALSARDEHTAVLDAVNGRMIVFGGRIGFADTNETWALDLAAGSEAWTQLQPTGTPPAARDSHAAVYDPTGKRMIVFSGFTGFPSTPFTDVWELLLP